MFCICPRNKLIIKSLPTKKTPGPCGLAGNSIKDLGRNTTNPTHTYTLSEDRDRGDTFPSTFKANKL